MVCVNGNGTISNDLGSGGFITAMEYHDDGFSASAVFISGDETGKREASCYEQLHVHHWAVSGSQPTVLSSSGIGNLMIQALNDSYYNNRQEVCFELTNGGSWDGFVRICYNYDTAQSGYYTYGGHSNQIDIFSFLRFFSRF